MPVTNLAELDALVARVEAAQKEFATYSQEKVDAIFRAASLAANQARIPLAQQAVAESGMGIVEDKVIKNHFASEFIYNKYKDEKTCGILEENEEFGTMTIAEPVGIICGIVPTTNPTSTAIFKSLISLKTRNGIIFSPHPRAKNSTNDAAKLVLDAAVAAGAPKDIIGWIDQPSVELSNALMKHDGIALILATGGPGMVKAAYSSGKPAIGVGAGNVPVVIDETADIKRAVASVLMSKTFDNGVVCASEQAVIVMDEVYDEVKERFATHKAHVLSKTDADKVRKVLLIDGNLNAKIVGQPATAIAEMAGVSVPADTKILVGEGIGEVSYDDEFAHEKLSPTLGMFRASSFENAVAQAVTMVEIGGIGHTSGLYTNQDTNADRIRYFGDKMKTARILVNIPTTHGGIGDLYNFNVAPSLTLGCGSWGGNSISENVGPKHLINKKTVAKRAENMLWHKLPKSIYFRRGSLPIAMSDLEGKKRAFLVTDRFLFNNGYADEIVKLLKAQGIEVQTFFDVEADSPTLSVVEKGAEAMKSFQPDVILALGGGSPMDAAKIMWVMYEHPETHFEELAMRFMDIRKRIYKFPKMGEKAELVCITTTSGTGSEVTPFAVVTDDKTGAKYPLADYELTPNMAIVDANLVMNMPKSLTAFGGYDAVTHALEAYVSVLANEYSDGQALQALKMLKEYLPSSYANGAADPIAREKVHNAATIAGIAFANAFLGVCHSMAHKVGAEFHVPHGLANALLISNVVRYNANDNPTKQTAFSQYASPQARRRYAEVADHLGLSQVGDRTAQKIERLLAWLEELKIALDIPLSIQAAGVPEADFLAKLDQLSVEAFDDQCTGANPRYPLISELKEVLTASYYGKAFVEGETFEGTTVIKKTEDQVAVKPVAKAKKQKAEA